MVVVLFYSKVEWQEDFLRNWQLLCWLNYPHTTTMYPSLSCLIISSTWTLYWSCDRGYVYMADLKCDCMGVLWLSRGNYRHYFVQSISTFHWRWSGTDNKWMFPSTPHIPICRLLLQYSLNPGCKEIGTTPFGQIFTVSVTPFLCSSDSAMSPSNLPLCSHALCSSVTSATKLKLTDCV